MRSYFAVRQSVITDSTTGDEASSWTCKAGAEDPVLVLGHGAGSNAQSELVQGLSRALHARGVSTLLYNYFYSEAGRKRPDHASKLKMIVRGNVQAVRGLLPKAPVFAGGHSMSGRMTSMTYADDPLDVHGIVFFAFPIAGKSAQRTPHLANVDRPMLFVQGTRDRLTPMAEIEPVVSELGDRAEMHVMDGADHSFKVLKRSGRSWQDAIDEAASATAEWIHRVLDEKGRP